MLRCFSTCDSEFNTHIQHVTKCRNHLTHVLTCVWNKICYTYCRTYFICVNSHAAHASEPQRRVRDFCLSISDLSELRRGLFVWVRQAGLTYGRAVDSETSKTPSTLQACSFFSDHFLAHPSLGHFASWTPPSDDHLVPRVCQCIWYFENSSASLWNPRYSEKADLLDSGTFCTLLAVSCLQLLQHKVIDKSQGDLESSNSNYCPLCPPWPILIARLVFEISISIFCVQIWSRQLFRTDCFWIFAAHHNLASSCSPQLGKWWLLPTAGTQV